MSEKVKHFKKLAKLVKKTEKERETPSR